MSSRMLDKMEQVTVTVTSPDGRLKAATRGDFLVEFAFHGKAGLDGYDADALGHQIVAMLRAIAEGRRRAVREAYARAGKILLDRDRPHWDADRRRYRTALGELSTSAHSSGEMIRIGIRGDRADFKIRIDPGLVAAGDDRAFLVELHSAYAAAISRFRSNRSALLKEHLPD
ncbi:MAG: hypothetical protein ACRD0P_09370 [Stackebrandtia sp.]